MDYKFIGWNNSGSADKVWGVIKLQGNQVVIFWGRRSKKLQTKIDWTGWDLDKLIRKKQNNGYRLIQDYDLNKVYPEFSSDLEKTTMWALLKS